MHRESMNQAQNFATIQQAQMSALLAQGQLQTPHTDWPAEGTGRPIVDLPDNPQPWMFGFGIWVGFSCTVSR
jgi:hypothetical protein